MAIDDAGASEHPPDDQDDQAGFEPEYDAALAESLAVPSSVDALYLEEASLYRPIGTGDVFIDVSIPGAPTFDSPQSLVMLVAHPCGIRRGATLEARAKSAPVVPAHGISKSKWTNGHFDFFPLPALKRVAGENGFALDDRAWGALLKEAVPVNTEKLTVDNRVACLGPEGLRLLLQRLVHSDTRVAVKPLAIEGTYKSEAEELELFESWNTDLVAQRVAAGETLHDALLAEAHEFDLFAGSGDPSPRQLLRNVDTISRGRKVVFQEIRRRQRGDP